MGQEALFSLPEPIEFECDLPEAPLIANSAKEEENHMN